MITRRTPPLVCKCRVKPTLGSDALAYDCRVFFSGDLVLEVPNPAISSCPLKCQAALHDTIHWQRLGWPMLLIAQWLYRKMGEGGSSAQPIEFQLNSKVLDRLFLGGFPSLRRTLF